MARLVKGLIPNVPVDTDDIIRWAKGINDILSNLTDFVADDVPVGDHGLLSGRTADDHKHYVLNLNENTDITGGTFSLTTDNFGEFAYLNITDEANGYQIGSAGAGTTVLTIKSHVDGANFLLAPGAGANLTSAAFGNFLAGVGAGQELTGQRNCLFLGNRAGFLVESSDILIIDNILRVSLARNFTDSIIVGLMNVIPASQTIQFNVGSFLTGVGAHSLLIETPDTNDITLTFSAIATGIFAWEGGNDYFKFSDDILLATNEKLYLRDTDIGFYSQANTFMDLFADGAVRIGNSSAGAPTTYLSVLPGGDTFWVGAGSGKLSGHMFTNTVIATTLVDQGTFYELDGATAWTAGHLNGCTFTDPGITVLTAGVYEVIWSLSTDFSSSPGSKQEIEYAIMVNGVIQDEGQAHRTLANSTDTGNACGVGSIDVAVNEVVSLAAKNETSSGKILQVAHGNLSIKQIGGV